MSGLNKLLDYYLGVKDSLEPLPKLLSGDEIMELLNIKPSKELGNIIKALTEAQLSSEVVSKDDALAFVSNIKKTYNVH
jgi:tRNA nucleotidyltransferase/poly(A) polymerase